MGSTAGHGQRAHAPGDVSSAGSGVSDRRLQAGSAGDGITFFAEDFITILNFRCKKKSVKSLHTPFRIIQNACYCLFSTDLNKICHIKYVYIVNKRK